MARSSYALILAGGSGTRFWPVSRNTRPKQLLNLFGTETMLEQTLKRLEGLIPKENILVLTNVEQEAGVRSVLVDLPPENIVAEPAKRDTAPAIALGIGWVAARDPEAIMMVLPADQLIQDTVAFQKVMRAAMEAADKGGALATVGIKPTWPCPSYGYIERSRLANIPEMESEAPVYEVASFREKPKPELAAQFLTQGGFSWNAGMFIWSIPTVVTELRKHCPELAAFIAKLEGASDFGEVITNDFASLPKISIDYALMEKATRVLNLEADFDWDDVGSWISVAKYLPADDQENRSNTALTTLDAQNNVIFSKENQHIALLGVHDLIVVQTADGLLIADRSRADEIKKIAENVPKHLH